MNELSIEAKAKRYDEAVENMRKFRDALNNHEELDLWVLKKEIVKDIEYYFPELKESEDERLWLIKFIQEEIDCLRFDVRDSEDRTKLANLRRSLAWLEKQGEHAKFRDSIQVGDKVTRNQDGVLVNLSQLKRIAKSTEEYNITGIGSKHAEGKLGEMIRNLKPLGETMQKSAWSEEDENILQGIWDEILANKHDAEKYDWKTYDKFLDWLKSLKERVQPKQEWSEEDEYMLDETIQHLKQLIEIDKTKHCACDVQYYQRDIDWLKSLKDKYTWKPSDEQMIALRQAICGCYDIEPLLELEKQLKKL